MPLWLVLVVIAARGRGRRRGENGPAIFVISGQEQAAAAALAFYANLITKSCGFRASSVPITEYSLYS